MPCGIGFFVWNDLREHGLHCRHYALQTKMVLSATAVCLFGGTLLFYLFEHNRLFAGMNFGEQLLNSCFCTVTPRTAGFNAVDNGALSESSKFLSIVFMFIGGAPGSTAVLPEQIFLDADWKNLLSPNQSSSLCSS